jgi:hypothetical protein
MYDCYRLCFAAFEIQLSWRIRGTAAAAGCYTRGTQFVGYAPISTAEPATLLQRQCGELRGAGAVRHIYAEQVSAAAPERAELGACLAFLPEDEHHCGHQAGPPGADTGGATDDVTDLSTRGIGLVGLSMQLDTWGLSAGD